MAPKRGLMDAVNDRQVKKQSSTVIQSKKHGNHLFLKIFISALFGFMGGFSVGRWIKII